MSGLLTGTVTFFFTDPSNTGGDLERITVDGGGRAIVVRTEVTEMFDHCSLAAAITLDRRPYFDRRWDLDLRQAQWRLAER